MPHGVLLFEPRNSENLTASQLDVANALHYAAIESGRFLRDLEPELIVVITPHGLAVPQQFLLYNDPRAEGSVSFEEWELPCYFPPCSYSAGMDLDVRVTEQLTAALAASGASVTSISGFGPPGAGDRPLPLGWAEVIPAYFIQRAYNESNTGSGAEPGPDAAAEGSATLSDATQQSWKEGDGADQAQEQVQGQGQGQGQEKRQRRPDRRVARRRLVTRGQSTHHDTHAAAASDASAAADVDARESNRPYTHTAKGSVAANEAATGHVAATAAAAAAAAAGARSATPRLPRAVLLGLPSRRYERSVAMVPELLALGRHLFTYLDPLDLRVAVVISGDLAHTWSADGPYGFSEHAAKFDAAVQDWARRLDRDALVKVAAKHVGEAKSCGFPGLVALQGVIDSIKPDNLHSVLLEYGHPLYYGMMCALFDFQGDA